MIVLISTLESPVTVCGGGAVTATFLPLGSSVVLYYVENGGVQNNRCV
jgi:hypothetical protein